MRSYFISICLFSGLLFPNFLKAQGQWGVTGGANLSKVLIKEEDTGVDEVRYFPVAGFQIGIFNDISIGKKVNLIPSLLFITKGYRSEAVANMGFHRLVKRKNNPAYIELPVDLIYNFSNRNNGFFAGINSYISYAIGGKGKYESFIDGEKKSESEYKLEFRNKAEVSSGDNIVTVNYGYSKPIDIGAGVILGYHFSNNLRMSLNADHSLINIFPKPEIPSDFQKRYNQQVRLSVGYSF